MGTTAGFAAACGLSFRRPARRRLCRRLCGQTATAMDAALTAKFGTLTAASVRRIARLPIGSGCRVFMGFNFDHILRGVLNDFHFLLRLRNGVMGFGFLHVSQIAKAGTTAIGLTDHIQAGTFQRLIADVGQYGQIVQCLLRTPRFGRRSGSTLFVRSAVCLVFISHFNHRRAKKIPASNEVRGNVSDDYIPWNP